MRYDAIPIKKTDVELGPEPKLDANNNLSLANNFMAKYDLGLPP